MRVKNRPWYKKPLCWACIGAVLIVLGLLAAFLFRGGDRKPTEPEKKPVSEIVDTPKQNEEKETEEVTTNELQPDPEPKTEDDPDVEQEPVYEQNPSAAEQVDGVWNLALVNPWNKLPDSSDPQLTYLDLPSYGGAQIDSRCYAQLVEMIEDCQDAGYDPYICSAYRTWGTQQSLFDNQVAQFESQGYDYEAAKALAAKEVAVPGTSEHQLGLAVDIIDTDNWNLDESQESMPTQQWLMANSWRYGFILRYPNGKSDITGIIYEPWHYRYVGRAVAQEIYSSGITLEEYLGRSAH